MAQRRRRGPGGEPPVPRDLPDQQAGEDSGEEGPDPEHPDESVPDTDEAGTGRRGAAQRGAVHPEHPPPHESPG
ncbi:hypothetical protein [Streptomyces sp. NPDC058045]|uniref:hypothetical protein n=1 Tax=Streptomyces sp. NPDC058045 TaxID=3346311 RepID=UPI0036E34A8C